VALEFFKSGGKPERSAEGQHHLLREREGAAAAIQARQDEPAAGVRDRAAGLDHWELCNALAKQPSFALMLMSTIIARIREGIALLAERSRKLQTALSDRPKTLTARLK